MNRHILKLIQSGAFYLFGRDKNFRPTLIIDFEALGRLEPVSDYEDGEYVTQTLVFLTNYMKKVMFLQGRIETYTIIYNLNQLSIA